MEEIKTTIYQCSFCPKYYKRKYFAERHEKGCHLNPNNCHKCFDCDYLEVDKIDGDYENNIRSEKTFFCKKKQLYMYTYKAEQKGFVSKLSGKPERMPIECEFYYFSIGVVDEWTER